MITLSCVPTDYSSRINHLQFFVAYLKARTVDLLMAGSCLRGLVTSLSLEKPRVQSQANPGTICVKHSGTRTNTFASTSILQSQYDSSNASSQLIYRRHYITPEIDRALT
jgi:hypothetical protein